MTVIILQWQSYKKKTLNKDILIVVILGFKYVGC
jgi:hypothetical protein